MNCGFHLGTSEKVFLPIANGGTFDTTTTSTYNEYVAFVTPCDGYLDYVIIRSEHYHGSTIVGLHKASTGTENPSTTASNSSTVTISTDDTPYKFSFGSSASFSAGDALAISMDPTSSSSTSGDFIATIVLVLDWNDQDVSNSGPPGYP